MLSYKAKLHGRCPFNRDWDYYELTVRSETFVNYFDEAKWEAMQPEWEKLIRWAAPTGMARWAIVTDVPGDMERTFEKWESRLYRTVADAEINPALAVQDGMVPDDIRALDNRPSVICVGGSTEWKWETAEEWIRSFPRVQPKDYALTPHVCRASSKGRKGQQNLFAV